MATETVGRQGSELAEWEDDGVSPFAGREPAVESRQQPTGPTLSYPSCGDWTCDDEDDWDSVGPDNEDYAAVRREHDIALYHHPREGWERRIYDERDRLSGGDPLWWGKPRDTLTP